MSTMRNGGYALLKLKTFNDIPDSSAVLNHFVQPFLRELIKQLLCEYDVSRLKFAIEDMDVKEIIRECDLLIKAGCTYKDHLTLRTMKGLLEKNKDLVVDGIQPGRTAALEAVRCELDCERENALLFSLQGHSSRVSPLPSYSLRANSYIYDVARKVSEILGPLPALRELKFRFGPGASIGLPKRKANVLTKLSLPEKTCSESILPMLDELCSEMPHLANEIRNCVVSPAKIAFVSKNYKTDRPIAIEPWLNTIVQLGIGDYMGARLRRFGVDIRDQSVNQRLAKHGSITGEVSTIDLSSASDTIPTVLVEQLLPEDWFNFLSKVRSCKMQVGEFTFRPQKFSSMGNGFTFPLETLIFHAISLVAAERDAKSTFFCNTYGDDMIVPVESFALTVNILETFGFRVNVEKSFTSPSLFRESCGCDYLNGHSVRPTYMRDFQVAKYLFAVCNRTRGTHLQGVCLRFLYACCRGFLLFGPPEYGDGHVHVDNPEKIFKRSQLERGWRGYLFSSYVKVDKVKHHDINAYRLGHLAPIYLTYLSEGRSEKSALDSKGRYGISDPLDADWIVRTLYTY